MGIASLRAGVIFLGLMIVGHASFAVGREQPQSPTDLVREGVEPLLQTLQSTDASTRAYAAIGLGKIGAAAEDAIPQLIHTLKDDDARVRRNAVLALQQIGRQTERSIPAS